MAIEKKKFFEIEIPQLKFKTKALASSPASLNNRTIKLDLTRLLRGKSLEATIKVSATKDKATGEITKLNLLGFYIRRAMRKSISYVEDSFSAECKKGKIRIKPFMITRKKVSRSVRKALRQGSKEFLIGYVKDKTPEEIFSDTISGKLQKTLSQKMKKIYPLAFCEIRQVKLEAEKEQ